MVQLFLESCLNFINLLLQFLVFLRGYEDFLVVQLLSGSDLIQSKFFLETCLRNLKYRKLLIKFPYIVLGLLFTHGTKRASFSQNPVSSEHFQSILFFVTQQENVLFYHFVHVLLESPGNLINKPLDI